MAIVKWKNRDVNDPWKQFRTLQDEINDLFDFSSTSPSTGLFDRKFSPAMDVIEGEKDFTLKCELPGLSEKDIDVSVASNVLTIRGEKKDEKETKKEKYYKKETWSGSFQRTLTVPGSVDPAGISAKMSDGVLTVVLPKREDAQKKIYSGKSSIGGLKWKKKIKRRNCLPPVIFTKRKTGLFCRWRCPVLRKTVLMY